MDLVDGHSVVGIQPIDGRLSSGSIRSTGAPSSGSIWAHTMPPRKKAKSAKANNDELEAVQEQYVALFGKLPGGQWGSNLEHLKRKIAEAHGVDLTGGGAAAAATAAAPAAPTVTSKRIDAIQAEIDDPGTHARYINALIEQLDLLSGSRGSRESRATRLY